MSPQVEFSHENMCPQRVPSVSSAFRANVDSSVKSAGRGCGPAKEVRQPYAALDVLAFR